MNTGYEIYKDLDALRGSGDPRIQDLKRAAQEKINEIRRLRLKRELQMRYIDDMTWDEIADASSRNRAETSDAPRKRVKRYIDTLRE